MKRSLRKLSGLGDELVAEWEPETVSPERLAEIEKDFQEHLKRGYFAADVTDHRDVIVHAFDKNAELVLIPRVQGGRD